MASYVSPKVIVGKSKLGKGLFARKEIKKGEVIVDFSKGFGEYIPLRQADKLYENGKDYMMQVDDDLFFAATKDGEIEDADFINHSCNPNCGIKDSLKVIVMHNIEIGEEVTIDYAMCESSKYKIKCGCGSKNCREFITGDDWKRQDLQKKYFGFFSSYLSAKIKRKGNRK